MSMLSQPELSRWEGIIHGLRVNELQSVLSHFKSNKLGKKQDLIQRCITFLNSSLYQQEVIKVISSMNQRNRPSPYQIPSGYGYRQPSYTNRYGQNQTGGYHNSYGSSSMYGNGGATYGQLYSHSQPRPAAGVNPVQLPFYDQIKIIMAPMLLPAMDSNIKAQRKEVYSFGIPSEYFPDLYYRDSQKPLPRREVQMRFFQLSGNYYSNPPLLDDFPLNCNVRLDEQSVVLPSVIPTNKPNVEPKRPSRPVNITAYCQPPRDMNRMHRLTVEWTADRRQWAVAVYIVNRVTADILRDRAVSNTMQKQPLETTKNTIMRRLTTGDDDGITMDQLRISLLCPLGRTRMRIPARGRDCTHLQCFDLELYLMMNEKRPTWKCAVCSMPAPYNRLIIDGYFQQLLIDVGTDTNEVELLKDGSYQTIREEVNELSDSDDDSPRPEVEDNKCAEVKKNNSVASTSSVVKKADDDIITLSDDEDSDLQRGVELSIQDLHAQQQQQQQQNTPKTPVLSQNDDDIIVLDDDTPPRLSKPPELPTSMEHRFMTMHMPSSSTAMPAPVRVSPSTSNSQQHLMNNQNPRSPPNYNITSPVQQNPYNYSTNWGGMASMNGQQQQHQQQQQQYTQRPGTFIGGNMQYMPPYYPLPTSAAQMTSQNSYRPQVNQMSPGQAPNLAQLLHTMNPQAFQNFPNTFGRPT